MTSTPSARTRPRAPGPRSVAVPVGVSCLLCLFGCTIAPLPEAGTAVEALEELPPPGFGTLGQAEISISLVSRDLRILLTPLEESVTRVAAPDAYDRLHALASAHTRVGPSDAVRFLVSMYTEEREAAFVPEDVQLISRGLRVTPLAVEPVTPTWGERRVQQRRTEMAVYAFPASVDLEGDVVVVYGFDESSAWTTILPRVQAERARARARAGSGR